MRIDRLLRKYNESGENATLKLRHVVEAEDNHHDNRHEGHALPLPVGESHLH
jgi:hypothetical protein